MKNFSSTTVITSSSNSTFKDLLNLTSAKGLKKSDLFILSGQKIISEFLQNPNHEIVFEVTTEKLGSILNNGKTLVFSKELFDELDIIGTHYNLLVCRQKEIQEMNLSAQACGLELILPLGDPNNLGAVLRSAFAFGSHKIILLKEACHPYHPKVIKASSGSSLKCQFYNSVSINELALDNASLSDEIKKNIYALDQNGIDLKNFQWPKNLRLLVGEEGKGLPSSKFNRLSIKMNSELESLNATVAVSIALYEWSKQ